MRKKAVVSLNKIFKSANSIEELDRLKVELLDSAVKEEKNSSISKKIRKTAIALFRKINKKKNNLLASMIEINLNTKVLKSPKQRQG